MKKNHSYVFLLFTGLTLTCLAGCKTKAPSTVVAEEFPTFYIEGHRGTRGLMPENTIPAMKKAVDVGANVLELDVQISKDGQVMVAHDPTLNTAITLLPNGDEIPKEDANKYILHQMDYADIRRFDVGSKYNPDFPQQQKQKAYIPLLGELIDSVEQYTAAQGLPPVIYNIEIKADPAKDGIYQPAPAELVKRVMDVVSEKKIGNRFYLQSFDIRQVQEVHRQYPQVVTGFLTSDKNASLEDNLRRIGFRPDIYSPHYGLVTDSLVAESHRQGMKLIPWTVNSPEEIEKLQQMGVDGIITDYPNLLGGKE
ncbi:glycerophosphodiester phosphodiesterase [Pontibacter sp. 172403-2]|uniref:glycerophosphodiester phosphodiesterase family protein n=1 Tax=Pontibacter rufus TaxID=2791028 RepID=UPI0018AFF3B8|nr:glycerophosphodiester phosphodiesterase family protein [Pontibacter sp. 172403-2]MBF9254941.1 glycerophosphodiester phosphodiesterase [Pontibacter sp. 172403-2]